MTTSISDIASRRLKAFRSDVSKGIEDGSVDRKGGEQGAGIIKRFAVITRGEALGHGEWVDSVMLQQVHDAIQDSQRGIKVRFTHPSMSGDGLGSFLGRVRDAELDGDVVRADLHFSRTAHDTPDGDLASYVMGLAESDPDAFGASISFRPDYEATDDHQAEHSGKEGFQSPDERNAKNLPHCRVDSLMAVDIVDQPAANPEGLFHRGAIVEELETLVGYSLGLNDRPKLIELDVDPDRIAGFVSRFLSRNGLSVVESERDDEMTKETEGVVDQVDEQVEQVDQTDLSVDTVEDPRKEAAKFIEAFGDKGGRWYAEGLSFDQAKDRYIEELKAENKRLQVGSDRGEENAVSFTCGEEEAESEFDKRFNGFAKKMPRSSALMASTIRISK